MNNCKACAWRNRRIERQEGGSAWTRGCVECDNNFNAFMQPLYYRQAEAEKERLRSIANAKKVKK